MWAQLQKVSTNPDREEDLLDIFEQLQAIEQQNSGLLQTVVMRSRADRTQVFVLVLFESEEKARLREDDARREEPLKRIRAAMGNVLNGPPEFFDCDVILNR